MSRAALAYLITAAAAFIHVGASVVRARPSFTQRLMSDPDLRHAARGQQGLADPALLGVALAFGAAAGPRAALTVYGPRAGRAAAPPLARLSSARAEAAAFALLAPGMGALTAALARAVGRLVRAHRALPVVRQAA